MNVKARHTQNNFYTHGAVRLCNDCFIYFFLFVSGTAAVSVAVLLQPLTAYMWVDTTDTIALAEDDVGTVCASCVVTRCRY